MNEASLDKRGPSTGGTGGGTGAQGPRGFPGDRGLGTIIIFTRNADRPPLPADGVFSGTQFTATGWSMDMAALTGTGKLWATYVGIFPDNSISYSGVFDPVGPMGTRGAQGERGAQGGQGVQGERGARGEAGPQGLQGNQGPRGEAGPAGTTQYSGLEGTIPADDIADGTLITRMFADGAVMDAQITGPISRGKIAKGERGKSVNTADNAQIDFDYDYIEFEDNNPNLPQFTVGTTSGAPIAVGQEVKVYVHLPSGSRDYRGAFATIKTDNTVEDVHNYASLSQKINAYTALNNTAEGDPLSTGRWHFILKFMGNARYILVLGGAR